MSERDNGMYLVTVYTTLGVSRASFASGVLARRFARRCRKNGTAVEIDYSPSRDFAYDTRWTITV